MIIQGGKFSEKNFISSRDGAEKIKKQDRGEKPSRTLPHYGMMPAPSLASNTMHLHP